MSRGRELRGSLMPEINAVSAWITFCLTEDDERILR